MLLTIQDAETLHNLIDKQSIRGEQVYTALGDVCDIDSWRGESPLVVFESSLAQSTALYRRAKPLFSRIGECYRVLKWALERQDGETFSSVISQVAERVVQIAQSEFELAYCYLGWHLYEDYPVMHQLLSALTLARVGAQSGGFAQGRLQSLVCAGLTMNIGMLDLQCTLQIQSEPLSRRQKEVIRKHPIEGHNTLKLLGVEDAVWLAAVQLHYEKPDGTGYPKQIKNEDEGALLLSICDSFNARMAQRNYRKNFAPEDAVKDLFEQGDVFTMNLASLLLQEVGIYPAGSILLLEGDLVACCLLRGKTPTMPQVLVFRDLMGKPVPAHLADTSDRRFSILRSIPRSAIEQEHELLGLIAQAA